MPASLPALNQPEQVDDYSDMENIVNDVLKPPGLDDFSFVDLTDRVVRYKARFVGALRPWLLVVHDVCDFVIIRASAVLLDVIASRVEWLGFIGRKDRRVVMDNRMIVQFALVPDGRQDESFKNRRPIQHH